MNKAFQLIWKISVYFMVPLLALTIIWKINNPDRDVSISNLFNIIQSFKGYETFAASWQRVQLAVSEWIAPTFSFDFNATGILEFFQSLGEFLYSIMRSIIGFFLVLFNIIRAFVEYIGYLLAFITTTLFGTPL